MLVCNLGGEGEKDAQKGGLLLCFALELSQFFSFFVPIFIYKKEKSVINP